MSGDDDPATVNGDATGTDDETTDSVGHDGDGADPTDDGNADDVANGRDALDTDRDPSHGDGDAAEARARPGDDAHRGDRTGPDDAGDTVSAPTGRGLHPLSVPYRAAARALRPTTLIVFVTVVGSGSMNPESAGFLAIVVGTLLLSIAFQYAYYLRFEYALGAETLDVTSGVVSRRSREIPLRRVQNVDVEQNPVQRAIGIAAVRVETAGGGDTEAVFEYVGREEARRLREELRRAARRARAGESETEPGADDAVESEREEVFAISTRSVVVLSLFSFDAGAGLVSSLVGTLLSGGDPTNLVGVQRVLTSVPLSPLETAVVGVAAVAALAWLLSVVLTFARYYGFRLVRVEDGLEYERGLLQQFSGSIPVDKVQTVSVRSNLAHRGLGYATVAVETAGYSPGSDRSARQLAVPLAPRDEALSVARSVKGFDRAALDVTRPPHRARQRYAVRFALVVAVLTGLAAVTLRLLATRGIGPGLAVDRRLLAVPALALLLTPLAAHLRWRSRGYRTTADHFVARTGYWRRVTRVVPYYRVQTVIDTRSVFQRRRRLATVVADTASSASLLGGDAAAIDVDADAATDLRERLRTELDRAIRRRASGGPDADDPAGDGPTGDDPDRGEDTPGPEPGPTGDDPDAAGDG